MRVLLFLRRNGQITARFYFVNHHVMEENRNKLLTRISTNPAIFAGKPIIRGLRFRVNDVLEMLANGMTKEMILEEHPLLEPEDIFACLLYTS